MLARHQVRPNAALQSQSSQFSSKFPQTSYTYTQQQESILKLLNFTLGYKARSFF